MEVPPPFDAQRAPGGSFVVALLEFCRVLNEHGIFVPPGSAHVALDALAQIDIGERLYVRHALCAALVNRPEDIAVFTVLFNAYWRTGEPADDEAAAPQPDGESSDVSENTPSADAEETIDDVLQRFSLEDFWRDEEQAENEDEGHDGSREDLTPESGLESLRNNDPRDLQRIVRALAAHFASRISRRFEPHRNGSMIHLRKTMRDSVKHGGIPIELAWRRRKIVRSRLVLFVDVSRSMASYAKLLLQFVTAVLRHAWRVEVYLFATKMLRVTHQQIEDDDVDINAIIAECGGGTRIGDNLLAFEEDYGHALTGNQSIAIILSDGLDSGEPEQLERAMSQLQRRTRQVIWLNPLLGTHGYESTTRDMSAALPHIDVLAPAHDIECFWQLLELLRSSSRAPAA